MFNMYDQIMVHVSRVNQDSTTKQIQQSDWLHAQSIIFILKNYPSRLVNPATMTVLGAQDRTTQNALSARPRGISQMILVLVQYLAQLKITFLLTLQSRNV
jgi:hypothetical protein